MSHPSTTVSNMKKQARELQVGDITTIIGSRNGYWYTKNWVVEEVTVGIAFIEVELTLHPSSRDGHGFRINNSEELSCRIAHRDEAYETFHVSGNISDRSI